MAQRGTIQEIAGATGVNQATVRRALSAAGLKSERGSYDFVTAVEAVKANADPARIAGHAASGRGEGGGSDATNTLAEARARAENLRARKLELETAKAEGRLINRDDVTETGAYIIAAARTALLALGYRLAEKVANKSDVREIARIIELEVRDVLGVLADEEKFFAILEVEALT